MLTRPELIDRPARAIAAREGFFITAAQAKARGLEFPTSCGLSAVRSSGGAALAPPEQQPVSDDSACQATTDRVRRTWSARDQAALGGAVEQVASIVAVALEMEDTYIASVREHVAEADGKIGSDKFHIAKHLGAVWIRLPQATKMPEEPFQYATD